MFKLILVAVFLPALVFGSTPVRQCSGRPFPHDVRIPGCSQMPCNAFQGQNMFMEMDFTVNTPVQRLIPSVQATAFGIVTAFPLPDDQREGCNNLLNTRCPLDAGERPTYRIGIYISKLYPPIPVNVELTLQDEYGRVLSCISVDVRVISGKQQILID